MPLPFDRTLLVAGVVVMIAGVLLHCWQGGKVWDSVSTYRPEPRLLYWTGLGFVATGCLLDLVSG